MIKLSPSSMGIGRANSSGVRLRVRRTLARLMERGRALRSSFVGCGGAADTVGSGGTVGTVGGVAVAVGTVGGVAAVGAGVEADCGTTFSTAVTCVEMASPPNFSCMAMMANLTPAGVMPWAVAISL